MRTWSLLLRPPALALRARGFWSWSRRFSLLLRAASCTRAALLLAPAAAGLLRSCCAELLEGPPVWGKVCRESQSSEGSVWQCSRQCRGTSTQTQHRHAKVTVPDGCDLSFTCGGVQQLLLAVLQLLAGCERVRAVVRFAWCTLLSQFACAGTCTRPACAVWCMLAVEVARATPVVTS